MSRPVFVTGAAAVSAFGFEWRGLGRALASGAMRPAPSMLLAESHPGVLAYEVPTIPATVDAGDARAWKLMSRGARLGAIGMMQTLRDAKWDEQRKEVGCYLGVGASGGSMAELTAMLLASVEDGQFSLERFGTKGLAACNPLFAFQLMNNFTLCHGAILSGIAGPNSAFYSRGTGTIAALMEAMYAVAEGDCDRAIAGGADSALHAVTWAELVREGYAADGLVPAEAAGLLALSAEAESPLAVLEVAAMRSQLAQGDELLTEVTDVDVVVVAAWGEPAREALHPAIAQFEGTKIVEAVGESLAAAPALAWVAALDLIASGESRRALVLNAGVDGGVGAVVMARPS